MNTKIGKKQAEAVAKAPFRLFGKIEKSWVDVPEQFGNARFMIRPMTISERSLLNSAEVKINQIRDFTGAIERANTTREEIFEDGFDVEKWNTVQAKTVFDEKAESRFNETVKVAILNCVSVVDIDDVETPFTAELYDSISDVDVVNWLLQEIKNQSFPSEAEKLSL